MILPLSEIILELFIGMRKIRYYYYYFFTTTVLNNYILSLKV